jgi:hypothetical protein
MLQCCGQWRRRRRRHGGIFCATNDRLHHPTTRELPIIITMLRRRLHCSRPWFPFPMSCQTLRKSWTIPSTKVAVFWTPHPMKNLAAFPLVDDDDTQLPLAPTRIVRLRLRKSSSSSSHHHHDNCQPQPCERRRRRQLVPMRVGRPCWVHCPPSRLKRLRACNRVAFAFVHHF